MGDLMDGGAYGLHLAHTFTDGDTLLFFAEIAVHTLHFFKSHRHRAGPAQGLYEYLVMLHIPVEFGGELRKGLALGLADIKHRHGTEHGDFHFLFLHDRLALPVQHWQPGVRVQLHFLDFLLEGRGGDDFDALLTLLDMPLKLIFPFVKARHAGGSRHLHVNQHLIVHRIGVKAGHGA